MTFEEWWQSCVFRHAMNLMETEHDFLAALAWNESAKQSAAEIAGLRAELERQPKWRCFHCGESFTEAQSQCAREHFGRDEGKKPVCLMRVPGENGLIAALRRAEDDLAEWRNESVPLMRAIECQAADHAQALIREEENGYAKGLKDYSKLEVETIALRAEVERLKAENDGMRNALAGVPDPAAFMTAVDAVVAEWVKPNATIMPIALAKALGTLCSARGKH